MASFRQTNRESAPSHMQEKTLEELQNMNRSELMQALLTERDKARANGTLNEETIKQFWDAISPSLNDEQKERMKELLKLL